MKQPSTPRRIRWPKRVGVRQLAKPAESADADDRGIEEGVVTTRMPSEATITCRDGRLFSFVPAKTALLVIDMQRDFLHPEGMCGLEGEGYLSLRAIIPTVQASLEDARAAGLTVVHTREGYAADLSDLPASRHGGDVGRTGPLGRFLVRGEAGHDFIEELPPAPGEAVIDKPGFSAFFRTDLEDRLKQAGISHLLFSGVTTQCCVLSSLREAVDRGFHCLLLEDCCAALDPAWHQATLDIIASEGNLFGWIADSRTLRAALSESG